MHPQFVSLRILNSSVRSFPLVKMEPAFPSVRGGRSIFTRVFPFRLKYASLLSKSQQAEDNSLRRFSTRTSESRSDYKSRPRRDFEPPASRGPRRGAFQSGSLSARGGGSKSLIDDEAELSDWVSELKTDSLRISLASEDEDSGRETVRERDRDSRVGREISAKRRRDVDSGDYRNNSSRPNSRRSVGSLSTKSKTRNDSFSDEFEDESDNSGDEEFDSRRRKQTGSRGGFSSNRGGLSSNRGGFSSNRGGLSSNRGGRASLAAARPGRGRGGDLERGRGSKRQTFPLLDSDDEEEDSDVSSADSEDDGDDGKDALRIPKFSRELVEENNTQAFPRNLSAESDSYLSVTRFDECSISSLSLKGIKEAGFERMTVVQEATLPIILKGKDVLAKAKTGTGKTVAFLLPAIEVITKLPPPDRDNKRPPINVLIVCPTRELANQAAKEAVSLLKFHPSIGAQVVIGGTRLTLEQKRMQTNPCQILVATPGRLRDHIENTPGFATRLMGVKVLVLDEADHLLDMGFRKDIEKIIAAVPKQRQTLLFSATVPEEVRQICHIALRRDHEFINTVEEGSEETHSQVKQMHLVAPLDQHFPMLYSILKDHISEEADYKVIIFCTTAMVTRLVAELLSELKLNVREIHSRKSQSYRDRVSDEFRKSKGLILVTSDVSARGVDYPDVTLVIQVGVPSDREQYIHRLGRTGRKGKEGSGILLLATWEEFFLSSIRNLPISKAPLTSVDPDSAKKVDHALAHVEMKDKAAAYQSWLGYYNSQKNVGRDKVKLVQLANEFSRSMGLDSPPAISKLVLGKMGLKNVPGLRVK
ncbi:DEAD-box ATP-dependent RNA helicase 31-like [Aristolochia californica]|uniref:DEAD-box ATP-dependent RNA helicase 31-like n=1 Tax=Aristolochia californica TaxID=171875 RepID=UPI0035D76BA7